MDLLKQTLGVLLRRNSCRFSQQAIFVVQSTQDRLSYNLTAARNPMPMFVWCDRKIDSWIRDALWSAFITRPHVYPDFSLANDRGIEHHDGSIKAWKDVIPQTLTVIPLVQNRLHP
jgi:hypothetical protein